MVDPTLRWCTIRSRLHCCFTEEKAKQLRMKTVEMSNFHDVMYHSAIASRLASDIENLKGEQLVNKDVKFAKLDDEDVVQGLQRCCNSSKIPFEKVGKQSKIRGQLCLVLFCFSIEDLRSTTKGSSKGKSVHTRVRTEVRHEVHVRTEVSRAHSKEEMILDLQLRLNSVEEKLKPGPSDVDHHDKTDNLSKNAPDCGLDQQSMRGVS
uniref:Uncharacterized protein n=1 Tax=Tanacetum cinerariifolium TaxID=118510 RepID=A0A699HCD3_TANCI|nr:hypothetical protein [Tanacetum cinerariifolium]